MRYTKLYRRLIFAAIVLLGLATGGDVVSLQLAQSRAAAGLAQVTAAERADVDLGGFPFLPRLVAGQLPHVEVEATGLSGAGLRVASLRVSGSEVQFATLGAIGIIRSPYGSSTPVEGIAPFARAEIGEGDLAEYLGRRIPALHDIEIDFSGVVARFSLADPDESATADDLVAVRYLPRIHDRRLVLRIAGVSDVPRDFEDQARAIEEMIELPTIPQGLRVDVELGEGVLILEATAPQIELLVGEANIASPPSS